MYGAGKEQVRGRWLLIDARSVKFREELMHLGQPNVRFKKSTKSPMSTGKPVVGFYCIVQQLIKRNLQASRCESAKFLLWQ